MNNFLQPQIHEMCRLAMPDGLKELMYDISREVLRDQPPDLYQFITDYLAALLHTRETLSIACQVNKEIGECSCQPELEEELGIIGLEGEDLETAVKVVLEYFDKDEPAKEENLLIQLFRKIDIDEDMLLAIEAAVRKAYLKHRMEHPSRIKVTPEPITDRGMEAAKRTLRFYEFDEEARNKVATKIQAWYRGTLARRNNSEIIIHIKEKMDKLKMLKKLNKGESGRYLSVDYLKPNAYKHRASIGRFSSASLAGSFINLPKRIPYSSHDEFEERETEHANVDYTEELSVTDLNIDHGKMAPHTLYDIESFSVEDDNSEDSIKEIAEKNTQSEVAAIHSNIRIIVTHDDDDDKDKQQIESTVNDIIEEILPQSGVSSDLESVEEELKSKSVDQDQKPKSSTKASYIKGIQVTDITGRNEPESERDISKVSFQPFEDIIESPDYEKSEIKQLQSHSDESFIHIHILEET